MATENEPSALFLSEHLSEINEGAGFLGRLSEEEQSAVRASGCPHRLTKGERLFFQGDRHNGVWIIEAGRVRTFYVGHSGREVTLAYWTPGHFVGGPEVFGGGRHVWSADAPETCELLFLPGPALRRLAVAHPSIALTIIDGLVAKGKCYSALVQMLGTRSVQERLELLLAILADSQGRDDEKSVTIERSITHEQLAMMVGATRQWVSASLEKMQKQGLISIELKRITLHDVPALTNRAIQV